MENSKNDYLKPPRPKIGNRLSRQNPSRDGLSQRGSIDLNLNIMHKDENINFFKISKTTISYRDDTIQEIQALSRDYWEDKSAEDVNSDEEDMVLYEKRKAIAKRSNQALSENSINQVGYRRTKTSELSQQEIKKMFDILDREKKNYINDRDVGRFLEMCGNPATPELLQEMIKLANPKEENKLRFNEFCAIARGSRGSPAEVGLPPTVAMLQSKKSNTQSETNTKPKVLSSKESREYYLNMVRIQLEPKEKKQCPKPTSYECQIIRNLAPVRTEVSVMKQQLDRKEKLEYFFKNENFNFTRALDFFKNNKTVNINAVDFDTFMIVSEFKDKIRAFYLFNGILRLPSKTLDFQELLVNWLGLQRWTVSNKAYMAFYVMDPHNYGILPFDSVMDLITWLHLEREPGNRKQILQKILEQIGIRSSKKIDMSIFTEIISGYETILFDQSAFKNRNFNP